MESSRQQSNAGKRLGPSATMSSGATAGAARESRAVADGSMYRDLVQVLLSLDREGKPEDWVEHLILRAAGHFAKNEIEAASAFATEAQEACWSRLHRGSWRSVSLGARHAYAISGTINALCTMLLHPDLIGQKDALRMLDLVVLLSGNLSTDFECLVQSLHDNIVEMSAESNEDEPRVKRARAKNDAELALPSAKDDVLRKDCPSLQWFLQHAMQAGAHLFACCWRRHPVIVAQAMGHWPCLASAEREWTLENLKRVAGLRTVPIELGKDYMDAGWSQRLMTVGEFIDQHMGVAGKGCGAAATKAYLAQHRLFDQIPALRRDIVVPDYCALTTCERRDGGDRGDHADDVEINAWIGPAGTVSNLHFDRKHNLLCQVRGRKLVRLYHPRCSHLLYAHDGLMSNTSRVPVEGETAKLADAFPLFIQAPYQECVLGPGEMLYIPPKHWHYIRSLQESVSVSFWWE